MPKRTLDTVKILGVDNGAEAPASPRASRPSPTATYPLSRPLYIYPNLARQRRTQTIVDFVDYYLSDTGIANVSRGGYVALPAEELEATRTAWEDAKP